MMAIRKKSIFRIAEWVANIVLFVLVSFIFYTSIPVKSSPTLYIPSGSVSTIISQLAKKGYALSAVDKYLLVAMGTPQSGWISIGKTKLNRIDFLHKLATGKAQMTEITLIPGETSTIFLHETAEELHLDPEKMERYYRDFSRYREAGIYADTYYVPVGIGEKHLIFFLVSESEKKYREISMKIYGTYNPKKWNRILTIASIIQKEAANNKEMPLIASVIYNRLRKNMPLQMDGSLNYGSYSHSKITPERIKNDKSPFNTYKHRGLPPYPVCAVSLTAIKAAVKPARTKYLYFMKNAEGVHDFSSSYRKHRKNIDRAKKSQK